MAEAAAGHHEEGGVSLKCRVETMESIACSPEGQGRLQADSHFCPCQWPPGVIDWRGEAVTEGEVDLVLPELVHRLPQQHTSPSYEEQWPVHRLSAITGSHVMLGVALNCSMRSD